MVRLKCRYETEIRTVVVNLTQVDYSELIRRLSKDFGFDVALKYEISMVTKLLAVKTTSKVWPMVST